MYRVMMQSILYPNEYRMEKMFSQLWFKPYMSLFGEMFKSETGTYVFDTISDQGYKLSSISWPMGVIVPTYEPYLRLC